MSKDTVDSALMAAPMIARMYGEGLPGLARPRISERVLELAIDAIGKNFDVAERDAFVAFQKTVDLTPKAHKMLDAAFARPLQTAATIKEAQERLVALTAEREQAWSSVLDAESEVDEARESGRCKRVPLFGQSSACDTIDTNEAMATYERGRLEKLNSDIGRAKDQIGD